MFEVNVTLFFNVIVVAGWEGLPKIRKYRLRYIRPVLLVHLKDERDYDVIKTFISWEAPPLLLGILHLSLTFYQ